MQATRAAVGARSQRELTERRMRAGVVEAGERVRLAGERRGGREDAAPGSRRSGGRRAGSAASSSPSSSAGSSPWAARRARRRASARECVDAQRLVSVDMGGDCTRPARPRGRPFGKRPLSAPVTRGHRDAAPACLPPPEVSPCSSVSSARVVAAASARRARWGPIAAACRRSARIDGRVARGSRGRVDEGHLVICELADRRRERVG